MNFDQILTKYRKISFSEADKGNRFERLMQRYLQTDPRYSFKFTDIWLWKDFPYKDKLGKQDTGIDLVAFTSDNEYWAIQCKCYKEDSSIDKPAVDSFLATSSRLFTDDEGKKCKFSHRLWISTTNNWGSNATEAIQNQVPPVTRINLIDLQEAPVDWDKLEQGLSGEQSRSAKKVLRPHQITAVESFSQHFEKEDRGRLIMACGTGKTFTSLRLAEKYSGNIGLILFLVPSISLLGQTLREWCSDAEYPIKPICVCSDAEISRKKVKDYDADSFSVVDLALPASTNPQKIIKQVKQAKEADKQGMTVIFSTYQSIDVVAETQRLLLQENEDSVFKMIICDEAHRTTGVTLADDDESAFVKVHDNNIIHAQKRLYMTATPRLYSEVSKSKAAQNEAVLCSMDDPEVYGAEVYRIGFGEAVERDLLTDYKVLILTLSDKDIPPSVQKSIADQDQEINADDAMKLIGCINALSKQLLESQEVISKSDPEPMKKAVAFCQKIIDSKKITATFNNTTDTYIEALPEEKRNRMVSIESQHIDGSMSAPVRDGLLGWLKEESDTCRILTNVRCLSEGVDVPSLDAVLFLSARNSQVDVVQSVGRVMRKADGKKYGYIIIPVVVPADVEASKALDDNKRYAVVWSVLNALRAHDDRFNATVNKIELNKKKPDNILIGKPDTTFDKDGNPVDNDSSGLTSEHRQLRLQFEELQSVVFARLVEKVGDRRYWEEWAKNVAEIAERQIERITHLIQSDKVHKTAFQQFIDGLQKNINPSITETQAIEMLSQHIITKPVFEALFEGYSFVQSNPISISMQKVLDLLEAHAVEKDVETLERFYDSVRKRAEGIDNAEGRQRIIIELYDKFFRTAFPKMVEQLGIVYTPIEVVDFILQSVNDVLKQEFGRTIADENIHVLDPFTGTGTFITRLLQSGLIDERDLHRKYNHELHANEIVLLAYYIAAINIETAFHDLMEEGSDYKDFEGICLTDTFQLGEHPTVESEVFPKNSARVKAQQKAPMMVIVGNPPYSAGQRSANDNAQNQQYLKLDSRIADTYAKRSKATLQRSLYDSYIRAFRWASDRIDNKNGGVVGFVSNGAWIDSNAQDGFRKTLEKEFSSIWVFNLRGNQRTSGELSRREGGKIFGSGSRTPISITLLVKKSSSTNGKAVIKYYDIGDYLKREEKLDVIKGFGSISSKDMKWTKIKPNAEGDWINQRNETFSSFIPIGAKKGKDINQAFFLPLYSNGIKTNRDAWCYNSNAKSLEEKISSSVDYYNQQVDSYSLVKDSKESLDFINFDGASFSWDRQQKKDLTLLKKYSFDKSSIRASHYRPFFKQNLYFNRELNNCVYQIPQLYPAPESKNLVICLPAPGGNKDFSVLMSNVIPDLHLIGDSQCFPLYLYEENKGRQLSLLNPVESVEDKYIKKEGVSDFIWERAKKQYGKNVNKEDIFYYVYGILHNKDYVSTFSDDLKKMLPRIPFAMDVRHFWKLSKAGRVLADLHLNYEDVAPYPDVTVIGAEHGNYIVQKMRFPKKGQKDTILYNGHITISNIPDKAYQYIVNGKSAIEWLMERYQVTTDKKSGIKNDPNDWATEVGNPRYILDLLLSVINVSVQTVDIVENLPALEFES